MKLTQSQKNQMREAGIRRDSAIREAVAVYEASIAPHKAEYVAKISNAFYAREAAEFCAVAEFNETIKKIKGQP